MTRLIPAVLLLPVTAACLRDDLVEERRSPDGALAARAWCIDMCDAPEARTITIGKAGAGDRGDAPDRDIAARLYVSPRKDALALKWTGPRALTVSGPCLADLNFKPMRPLRYRDVSISFVRSPGDEPCWQAGGRDGGRG